MTKYVKDIALTQEREFESAHFTVIAPGTHEKSLREKTHAKQQAFVDSSLVKRAIL